MCGGSTDRWPPMLPGHIADSTLDDHEDTVRLHLKPAAAGRGQGSSGVAPAQTASKLSR